MSATRTELLRDALVELRAMRTRLRALEHAAPIAIVGMACRLPGGVDSPRALWELLHAGVDAVGPVPRARWDADALYHPDPDHPGTSTGRRGAFLDRVDEFDPAFFGITPREAAAMDPQQRLALEVAWEALEDANIPPTSLRGGDTGVFVGVMSQDYGHLSHAPEQIGPHTGSGTAPSVVAGRISHVLGLMGPTLVVDTACSSSLVAVHLACRALRAGECGLALAGGVSLMLSPVLQLIESRARMLAPDGRCKTFDAAADGIVRGEGCGLIALKRLDRALADGDPIRAVIRGTAVGHDGPSSGLTVPSADAQERLIRRALADAAVDPGAIGYVEAHGTGTALGDPIELESLRAVFRPDPGPAAPLLVGSLKTNFGHLEGAAGIAGLLKLVLALQHGTVPPHLHLRRPNPRFAWSSGAIAVPTTATPWPRDPATPRLGGVSSFGFSGTNAHVCVSEAPADLPRDPRAAPDPLPVDPRAHTGLPVDPRAHAPDGPPHPAAGPHLFPISAAHDASLERLCARHEQRLATSPAPFADLCAAAARGRSHLARRVCVLASSAAEAAAALRQRDAGFVRPTLAPGERGPGVAFLFTGQGSQHSGMGRALYDRGAAFRAAIDRCAELLRGRLAWPLQDLLFAPARAAELGETRHSQPALFALAYGLAEQWRAWGVEPAAVLGHSVGEYVAATLAGVLPLADALDLIAERGRLMQALPAGGAMLAVSAGLAEVEPRLPTGRDRIDLAAINGPRSLVLSGDADVLDPLAAELTAAGLRCARLRVSHAFHSPRMDPMLDEFARVAARLRLARPTLPFVSTVSGRLADDELAAPDYWVRHARATVRFADGLATLYALGHRSFLELGPRPVLLGMAASCLASRPHLAVPSLQPPRDDLAAMLQAAATLHVHGHELAWAQLEPHDRRAALPSYPFHRQRYWLEHPRAPTSDASTWSSPDRDAPVPTSDRDAPASTRSVHASETRPADRGAGASASTWSSSDPGASAPTGSSSGPGASAHPLLGAPIRLATGASVFSLRGDALPALFAEHRVHGEPILPVAAMLEMALAAGAAHDPAAARALGEARLLQPLALAAPARLELQVLLTPHAAGLRCELWSRRDGRRDFTPHMRCELRPAPAAEPPPDLARLRERLAVPVDLAAFYRGYRELGVEHGPRFAALHALFGRDGEALAEIRVPDADRHDYHLHPVVLDACLQAIGAAFPDLHGRELQLPVTLGALEWIASPGARVFCHVRRADGDGPGMRVHLDVLDPQGHPLLRLRDLAARRVEPGAWRPARPDPTGDAPAAPSRPARDRPTDVGVEPIADGTSGRAPGPIVRVADGTSGRASGPVVRVERVVWQPGPPPQPRPLRGTWLVFCCDTELGRGLVALLRREVRVLVLRPAGAWATDGPDCIHLDPRAPGHFERLLEPFAAEPPAGVIFAWGEGRGEPLEPGALQRAQELGCGALLHWAQAQQRRPELAETRLWVLTRGAQAVADGEPVDPTHAGLWGLAPVIASEHPPSRCTVIDLPGGPSDDPDALAGLRDELTADDDEPRVALRGGRRLVARLHPLAPAPATWRPDPAGAYLITGGLGALGRAVADDLLRAGAGAIVLCSRTVAAGTDAPAGLATANRTAASAGLTAADRTDASAGLAAVDRTAASAGLTAADRTDAPAGLATVDRTAAASRVHIVAADVADATQLDALLRRFGADLPPLRGVVHAAGVLDDGLLAGATWERFAAVLRPKVLGAWLLHTRTRGLPLDLFVGFSSAASLLGSPGQGSYAAGNAFMDALAHHRRALGLPATAIQWGPVATAGPARADPQRMRAWGLRDLPVADALALMRRLLASATPQAAALAVDWEAFRRARGAAPFALVPAAADPGAGRLRARLRELPGPARAEALRRHLRAAVAGVSGLPADQLPERGSLFELGLDSLMAVELRNRLSHDLGAALSTSLLFDHPSLARLHEHLSAGLLADLLAPANPRPDDGGEPPADRRDPERDRRAPAAEDHGEPDADRYDALSVEALAALLAEKLEDSAP